MPDSGLLHLQRNPYSRDLRRSRRPPSILTRPIGDAGAPETTGFAFAVAIERTQGTGARSRSSVTSVYCCITSRESRARNTRLVTAKPGCRTLYENHDARPLLLVCGRRSGAAANRGTALQLLPTSAGKQLVSELRKSFEIESLMSRTQHPSASLGCTRFRSFDLKSGYAHVSRGEQRKANATQPWHKAHQAAFWVERFVCILQ